MAAQHELDRPAVAEAFVRAGRQPVTLVAAPAGTGKSAAIGAFLASHGPRAIRFDVRASHASLSRFVRGFADALAVELPRVAQSLAIAHERAQQSPRPAELLAGWLAEHLGDAPRTIVIDDYHFCERDDDVASFVAHAIERTRATTRWIVATRSPARLPLAIWLARGDALAPIDAHALGVTAAEASALARIHAPGLDEDLVERLRTATRGAIGPIVFALRTAGMAPGLARRALDGLGDPYERFAAEALARLAPADRRFLEDAAAFPDLDDALLVTAGFADAPERLAALATTIPQAFEDRARPRRLNPLFAQTVLARLEARDADAIAAALRRAARALERCERIAEALASYIRARDVDAVATLVDTRGLALVETGYGDTIADAIGRLDPVVQNGSAAILAIKAMFESRCGRFDTAESWFALAIERAGDPAVRDRVSYQYGIHLLRSFRPEAIARFEGLASDPDVATELRCYALAALGPAYLFRDRTAEAVAVTDRALAMLADATNPHLRARALHQASFVALHRHDGARANRLASDSLAIASEHGYFEIAAGALTVLYNAAADIADDPPESLRLLDAVADCAAKSGSLVNHVVALVAKLEIEVERGDDAAIARLDEKLTAIDVRASGRSVFEALLPSQALRASWSGDFEGAYRLLASSAEQQWSADRRALRFAEIATYAAAATLRAESTDAIRRACALLESLEPSPRRTRASLCVALALVLSGRGEDARAMLAAIEEARQVSSPRLDALRATVEALLERYRGARNHGALLAACALLEERYFGGIARLVRALPLRDNFATRVDDLPASDRRILARLAEGSPVAGEARLDELVRILGCADRRAMTRAMARHATLGRVSFAMPAPREFAGP